MKHYAIVVYVIIMCLSICRYVTSQCPTEVAKHRIM